MNKAILTILFLMVVCFSENCFANQLYYTGCSESNCIRKVVDNKIYLKPTTIYVANNGIFINIEGTLHAVNHLETDDEGVYIDATRTGSWIVGECPVCHDVTIFGICMNSACKSKRKD